MKERQRRPRPPATRIGFIRRVVTSVSGTPRATMAQPAPSCDRIGLRRHQIEVAAARVLEQRDVARLPVRPGAPAADQVVEVAEHVLLPDGAARDRLQDVADSVEGGLAPVHEDARAAGGRVVGLARLGRVAADEVEVGAGLEPFAPDQGACERASRR